MSVLLVEAEERADRNLRLAEETLVLARSLMTLLWLGQIKGREPSSTGLGER